MTRNKELMLQGMWGGESYQGGVNFMRKLKRWTRKHKGKLPFKFFNCGRIGHYAKRCPFLKNKCFHKKNIFSEEYNGSKYESDIDKGMQEKLSS